MQKSRKPPVMSRVFHRPGMQRPCGWQDGAMIKVRLAYEDRQLAL